MLSAKHKRKIIIDIIFYVIVFAVLFVLKLTKL